MESERGKVINTLPRHIKEQKNAHQQTDGIDQVDTILNSEIEELRRNLQEQTSIYRKEKHDWKNAEKANEAKISK